MGVGGWGLGVGVWIGIRMGTGMGTGMDVDGRGRTYLVVEKVRDVCVCRVVCGGLKRGLRDRAGLTQGVGEGGVMS